MGKIRSESDEDARDHDGALERAIPDPWNGAAMITSLYSFDESPSGLLVLTVQVLWRVSEIDTTYATGKKTREIHLDGGRHILRLKPHSRWY